MEVTQKKTVRLFTLAQFGIIVMFAIVTAFSLVRLNDVQHILISLTEETVPTITQTSALNNQIQSLATLTTFLAESSSNPERQLAKRKISDVISKINISMSNSKTDTMSFSKQLNTVYSEVNELDELVEQRIKQENIMSDNFNLFYDSIFMFFGNIELTQKHSIEDDLLETLLLTIQIDQQTRLHELRNIEADLKHQIKSIKDSLSNSQRDLLPTLSLLQNMVVGDVGLVSQKIESLKLIGRTRGRDSFVRNLITDVASSLQYQSQLINQELIVSASNAVKEVSKQTTFAIWTGIASIFIALGFIYYLYRKIVLRILTLVKQVKSAARDSSAIVSIEGNDEITELASTFSLYQKRVIDQEKALLDMTLTDPLTGIPNRRAFENQINEMISQSRRNNWTLTILLIDIDFFKPYNDHYGHTDGDACLRLVANQLNSFVLRNTDFCARYGGEEFVCLLPNTQTDGAKQKSQDLRIAIEALQIPHIGNKASDVVTVSVGAATFPFSSDQNWSADIITEQADKALYQAKHEGRNRCSYFSVK